MPVPENFARLTSLLLTTLAIGGNIFVLICILGHKALQRPGHLFIASLAVADLTLALTVMIPRYLG